MAFDRPKKPGQPQRKPSPNQTRETNQPSNPNQPRRIITIGGGQGGSGNNNISTGQGSSNNRNKSPSPWLDPDNEPNPAKTASFVEYLRWMRSPDSDYKDPTKVQLLQIAEQKANYGERLTQLTQRTKQIAGEKNTFQVKCPWRVRVGGHRGPESILLPAFDALGMPYIPSSTLRGVARSQAIQEIMAEKGVNWKEAQRRVAPYFGSLETENPNHRAGKVIFLDAYPLPSQSGVLAMDIANNLWQWNGNGTEYKANPNAFLSLKEPTFLIGLRLASGCDDTQVLDRVRQWLVAGLQSGIGSQVNTGYGEFIKAGQSHNNQFFRVDFSLEGQLIHGRQKFRNVFQPYQKDQQGNFKVDNQGRLKPDTTPDAEVRPVAFKSMLRYWFRVFALGVLEPEQAKSWEAALFGAINPQTRGWVMVRIISGKVTQKEAQSKTDPCGDQEGILTLAYSSAAPEADQDAIADLFRNLTWLMFHLGGIGQGARRPCYSRENRQYAPWYRGSTLFIDSDDPFWILPPNPKEFQPLFQQRLQNFYTALSKLGARVNHRSLKTVGSASRDRWVEAVDANCCIFVCAGEQDFGKPYALAVLHSRELKTQDGKYDGNLCGKTSKPSPVWIADLGYYQVVTVFGATQEPRKKYLQQLRNRTTPQNYIQIFPIPLKP